MFKYINFLILINFILITMRSNDAHYTKIMFDVHDIMFNDIHISFVDSRT